MIRLLPVFLLFIFSIHGQAQITKQTVIGNWICKEAVSTLSDGEDLQLKASLETLKKGFVNAHFIFREDGIFNLKLPVDAPTVLQEMKFLNNQEWSVDLDKNIIHIGAPRENIAQMAVKQQSPFLLLAFSDVPLILKMERIIK